jgi:protein-tyrosine-phosphatase/predicted ATP-grasp superfamily ATP-dependent carboligase
MDTVLVLGDDTRSFLSVVRSLGRKGVHVHAAPYDFAGAALKSRYIRGVHRLPLYEQDPGAWLGRLLALAAELRPDFIIPCDDRGILPMHHHRAALGDLNLGLPNPLALELFYDKAATRELAIAEGVPVAVGKRLERGDTAEALVAAFGLPLFVKPRRSYRLEAITRRHSVAVCRTPAEVAAALARIGEPENFVVEAAAPGIGVGVSVLARDGVVSQIFQHRRIAEPADGGSSAYRESEPLDPELAGMTRALCAASRLDGIAMFEYRVDDATGGKALLEVNARCWGSMPLAVAAGVDFPALWYDQAVHGKVAPTARYRVPYYARNFFGDVYATAERLSLLRRAGLGTAAGAALGWAASFGRVLTGRESHDAFAWADPAPAFAEYAELTRLIAGKVARRLPRAGRRREARARAAVRAAWAARAADRPFEILVLCYGNICRSPYAAQALAQRLAGLSQPVAISGAGLGFAPGRPSPEIAREAAAARGVSLDAHRSAYADDALLARADLILTFDAKNAAMLAARGIGHAPVALGAFVGVKEITDPYGHDAAAFAHCYALIDRAVDAVADSLRRG